MARMDALEESGKEARYAIGIHCMEYILRDGHDLSYAQTLVEKLIDLDFHSEAITATGALLAQHPQNAMSFYLRAIAYHRQHQYDLATADIMRAIELDPTNNDFKAELRSITDEKIIWNEVDDLNRRLDGAADSFPILVQRAESFFSIKAYDAVSYDLGEASTMRSPADSIYYIEKLKVALQGTRRPADVLREMLLHFQGLAHESAQ